MSGIEPDAYDVPDWSGHLLYLPPWRDRLTNGELGAFHGPMTLPEYERAFRAYRDNYNAIGAGGLWDDEQEDAMPYSSVVERKTRKELQRYDAEPMRRFVSLFSARLPPREEEVYCLYFGDGRSLSQCAAIMGMAPTGAYGVLKSLRRRMRAWLASRGG